MIDLYAFLSFSPVPSRNGMEEDLNCRNWSSEHFHVDGSKYQAKQNAVTCGVGYRNV